MAQIKILRGRHDEAERLLLSARTVLEKRLGHDDPETCKVIGILGDLYRAKAQFDKAEPLLRDSLTATERRLGPASADTLEAYLRLSSLLSEMGRRDDAVALLRTGLNTVEQRIGATTRAPLPSDKLWLRLVNRRPQAPPSPPARRSCGPLARAVSKPHWGPTRSRCRRWLI